MSFAQLCIYDLDSGAVQTVLKTDDHIEAPNWTLDGTALIVNADGLLYRVPLDAPTLTPVDTGFATGLNNDHGISPDGKTLAISDKTEDGKSIIYTMPIGGGRPQRVTPNGPSYFHGWSPDGQTITYPAFRASTGDTAQIYTIPATGGDEQQITEGFDHCDGSDYTPDGKWIWFNGEKDGAVDLWRIHPDGTGLERMTDDAMVNWFPHPSPDGALVVYLAYPEGTEGHPFGRNVSLRLMPADGGTPVILTEFFGGQGTINVPSWSPCSRKFAYVTYASK
ncbi:TolB family protein [Pseudoprimorskyibacter insulae]|uniref:Protein TolB n=1 Tax=Pseudoprimorskyibacter insulae TaxID=1695997 RepID=A0A2R8AZZ0_9RHOB|nr:TolB family protein [Pseudoprimorskyibacter insulae]SPF81596.1 Protein TolB [Pseudoprimorskyibacter insulae]